jgi:hypothetical protein
LRSESVLILASHAAPCTGGAAVVPFCAGGAIRQTRAMSYVDRALRNITAALADRRAAGTGDLVETRHPTDAHFAPANRLPEEGQSPAAILPAGQSPRSADARLRRAAACPTRSADRARRVAYSGSTGSCVFGSSKNLRSWRFRKPSPRQTSTHKLFIMRALEGIANIPARAFKLRDARKG